MPPVLPDAVLASLAARGVVLDAAQRTRIEAFVERLLEANTAFNLTAVRDADTAFVRHVEDSLTLLPHLTAAGAKRIADLGSGGGLPGIPIAIARPDLEITLIESTGKKARFLEQTVAALGATRVRVECGRAETIGAPSGGHRNRYDAVVARAVARLPVLLELALPLVRIGGRVLAIKGAQAETEIEEAGAALRLLHARVVATERTPTGTVVVVQKLRSTPARFPRRPGEPRRSPLS